MGLVVFSVIKTSIVHLSGFLITMIVTEIKGTVAAAGIVTLRRRFRHHLRDVARAVLAFQVAISEQACQQRS